MRIGIDISQTAHAGTGVGNFVEKLVVHLAKLDKDNEYILFFSSLRRNIKKEILDLRSTNKNITIKVFRFPPKILEFIWNRLHAFYIEWFIGDIDIFISSDWTQPPTKKAKKVTILYDMIVYKYPEETAKKIIDVQKKRLEYVRKECDKIICISKATEADAKKILGIPEEKLVVIYPGA